MTAAERRLKAALERRYRETNTASFTAADPVQFPRRFSRREDIEAAAFLASAIAWGRRPGIIASCERLFSLLGPSPARFIAAGDFTRLETPPGEARRCVHRTFFTDDLAWQCRGLRACFERPGGLEALFAGAADVWDGIARFRAVMEAANGGVRSKHLSNPAVSACKRLHLCLRWLVRREGPVDLGLWRRIPPAALCIPLDVHTARAARRLGLLTRGAADRKAAEELTARLRVFCPEDPARYDLALFAMDEQAAPR